MNVFYAIILAALLSHIPSVVPYISETVHPNIRGTLATLPAFMMAAGMLMVWIIGYFLTWRMTAYILGFFISRTEISVVHRNLD